MPLLMCPNCNASMTEVKRNDVAFDMCPTCRGVWLDRGELEKIIAGVQRTSARFEQDRGSILPGAATPTADRSRNSNSSARSRATASAASTVSAASKASVAKRLRPARRPAAPRAAASTCSTFSATEIASPDKRRPFI